MKTSSSHQATDTAISQRQTINIPIEAGLISLRGLSPQRLRFELEYALERGSTANAFLFLPVMTRKDNLNRLSLYTPLATPMPRFSYPHSPRPYLQIPQRSRWSLVTSTPTESRY